MNQPLPAVKGIGHDDEQVDLVLSFWLCSAARDRGAGGPEEQFWSSANAQLDHDIRVKFGQLIEEARAGHLDAWRKRRAGRSRSSS